MTDDQKKKCQAIIHTSAIGCGAGNCIPIPGTGLAADIIAMTAMTMSLSAVFGGSVTEEVAKGMAIAALKKTLLKQPLKVITKELAKLIPFAGQAVAATVSAGMIEAAGWALATDLSRKFQEKRF